MIGQKNKNRLVNIYPMRYTHQCDTPMTVVELGHRIKIKINLPNETESILDQQLWLILPMRINEYFLVANRMKELTKQYIID